MKRLLHLLLFLSLLTPAFAAEWGDPSGFFDREKIERTELYPGVIWWSVEGQLNGRPLRTQVVTVDLAREDIELKSLLGARFVNLDSGQFFRRSRTSQLREDNQALVAINVAFFDIGATQTPHGLAMQDQMIFREPSGRTSLLIEPGKAAIADVQWEARIESGSRNRPLHGINRPTLSGDEVVLYQSPWAKSPGNSAAFTEGQKVREIVLEKSDFRPVQQASEQSKLVGTVTEIRDNRPGIEIGENQFVLTASPSAAPFFRNLRPGQQLTVSWRLTNLPNDMEWHTVREVVSASPVLVRNGEAQARSSSLWTSAHPRSAVGISQDGQKLALVLIDGRSKESVGIALPDLGRFLVHLGSHNGLNFDGGGSSALAADLAGKPQLLNKPSDRNERFVPTGLGVIAFGHLLKQSRIWTGANGVQIEAVFADFDSSSRQVTLTSDTERYAFPIESLSEADQQLILRAEKIR